MDKVNRVKTGEADGVNLEVDSKDEVMRSVIFKEMVGGRERVTRYEERILRRGWKEIRL